MEDETLLRTILFDFFGDLLTVKQREYFDLYYNEDYSLSEIADKEHISKQSVFDTIHRAESLLREIESKTNIVRKWRENLRELEQAETDARELMALCKDDPVREPLASNLLQVITRVNLQEP